MNPNRELVMKMTRDLAAAIAADCSLVCGGQRRVEPGRRDWDGMNLDQRDAGYDDGYNFLLWGPDNDLCDTTPIGKLVGEEFKTRDGWLALDCYCYFTRGEHKGDLDCNVYVLIDPAGDVVYTSARDLECTADIDAIMKAAGHPGYNPTLFVGGA